jgi:hypothetical protein
VVAAIETRSLGAALDIANLLIESRTKRRHAASVGLKDDQEAVLGFGIEDEIAAAITQIGMELALQLIAVCLFDFRDRIPTPIPVSVSIADSFPMSIRTNTRRLNIRKRSCGPPTKCPYRH